MNKRAMTEEEIVERSNALAEKFYNTPAYQAASTIYGYLPYNQEVRTVPMLQRALDDGKRVAVPKVYGEEMRFIYLDMPGFRSQSQTHRWQMTKGRWC